MRNTGDSHPLSRRASNSWQYKYEWTATSNSSEKADTPSHPRGTLLKLNNETAHLWTHGYKPKLKTYDGAETPKPLRIHIQYGQADIVQVAKDILGLTKLNYNNAKLANTQPVTIEFSEDVGEILVDNPKAANPKTQFRYYI